MPIWEALKLAQPKDIEYLETNPFANYLFQIFIESDQSTPKDQVKPREFRMHFSIKNSSFQHECGQNPAKVGEYLNLQSGDDTAITDPNGYRLFVQKQVQVIVKFKSNHLNRFPEKSEYNFLRIAQM